MKAQTFIPQLVLLLIAMSVTPLGVGAQDVKMKRQTTGVTGSSSEINLAGDQWVVQQSIGQASVIGFGRSGSLHLRQGFIQAELSLGSVAENTNLNVQIYPNPFGGEFNILFDDVVGDEIFIDITDLSGRSIQSRQFAPAQDLIYKFPDTAPGIYIIRIYAGNKHFTGRIQKLNL